MAKPAFKTMASHKSWEWPTPVEVYKTLDNEFHFDFDPCPLGGTVDGRARLTNSWNGRRVFCNPPYGPEIRKFLECWGDAALAVYLVPARTDTRWFHEICLPYATEIRFIKGRLRFGDSKYPAPFPSMLVIFDNQNEQPWLSEIAPVFDDDLRMLGWQDEIKEECLIMLEGVPQR